jgi:3-keto-disaccharide hydrolase
MDERGAKFASRFAFGCLIGSCERLSSATLPPRVTDSEAVAVRLLSTIAFVFGLGFATTSALAQDDPSTPPEFVAIFDGKDLAGWHGMPHFDPRDLAKLSEPDRAAKIAEWTSDAKKHWSVKDGALVNDGEGPYLTTDAEYGDIELLIDYRTVPKADSGIYLRGTPQVQIWDPTEESKFSLGADKGSGGLWNNSAGRPGKDPSVKADRPFGEWNKFQIYQVGARTTVHLNGERVVDHAIMENYWDRNTPLLAKGVIQLQTHGGEIAWKNIAIRQIGSAEANEVLSTHNDDGFTPIFDGKSLAGWSGASNNYEVVNGSIRCKADKGGVLFHEGELADFVARLEFKLPPGGNNGLAIRYPGEGDAAYSGMTELQVLDSESEKYATLDPRQYHGSAYGMAPAARGYLRPTGEWNFQEVTIRGSAIQVELNGNVILDTDLSKINEYMANSPHPGKDRKTGYFGFAGHGDPVEFRAIRIKKL